MTKTKYLDPDKPNEPLFTFDAAGRPCGRRHLRIGNAKLKERARKQQLVKYQEWQNENQKLEEIIKKVRK